MLECPVSGRQRRFFEREHVQDLRGMFAQVYVASRVTTVFLEQGEVQAQHLSAMGTCSERGQSSVPSSVQGQRREVAELRKVARRLPLKWVKWKR
jgi:hypothetical protein